MVQKSERISLPFCHNPHVWQTDRRTDSFLVASPRWHSMQRGSVKFSPLKRLDIASDVEYSESQCMIRIAFFRTYSMVSDWASDFRKLCPYRITDHWRVFTYVSDYRHT